MSEFRNDSASPTVSLAMGTPESLPVASAIFLLLIDSTDKVCDQVVVTIFF